MGPRLHERVLNQAGRAKQLDALATKPRRARRDDEVQAAPARRGIEAAGHERTANVGCCGIGDVVINHAKQV